MIESNCTFIPRMRLMYPAHGGSLLTVNAKDPVYAVQEGYAMNREGTGDNRYQVLLMPAGDVIAAFWTELGPAEDFMMDAGGQKYRIPPYFQIVLMEHTVDECQYMALQNRADDYAAQLLDQQINESDLFEKYAQLIEEDRYVVKNRSTFGAGMTKQRNGYSALTAREQHRRLNGY